ncbi:hypothetical protein [Hymenobacter negativus]|uniref:Uncharacterized protein n=1 Tax=Hymenobacter negativus TaxID=2795026 RepID=A0ABS3QD56_9BACT|nr:hypothetical protein [Hymenobacter negativus]MBO2009165.1 hypothetical protein [Hymenobacter negativus]
MSTLREQIQQMIRGEIPTQALLGTVLTVDRAKGVCDVQPAEAGAPVLLDVALRTVEGVGGFVLWPKEGSFVVVGLVDNDPNHCYVAMVSEVAQFTLSTATDSAGKLFADLFAAIGQLSVTTGTGPSGPPINLPAFQALAQRAAQLFTA